MYFNVISSNMIFEMFFLLNVNSDIYNSKASFVVRNSNLCNLKSVCEAPPLYSKN